MSHTWPSGLMTSRGNVTHGPDDDRGVSLSVRSPRGGSESTISLTPTLARSLANNLLTIADMVDRESA